ncbi:hypothetical protein [Coraliomargarita akajimensis]|uniref:Uncharacterized protein n=1 Tax=Coraliomargarita akajimensis (strain DSM 45221 / IAM 15411 / JCM 23193 / KCTC 12865 / 04OKA010-24) TaxID=583355 RepID=D5EMC6_CORAD|nr:hypothetical protein [Coraliomargarita akajimensis]ADE53332.1 hypothetical protein Caka_0307 [Coraliomargarita akajimensis DSM 45221]
MKTIIATVLLLSALQSLSAGIIKQERSEDLNEDGTTDYWSTTYFRNDEKILERTKVHTEFNSKIVTSYINRVLLKEKTLITSMRRENSSAVTIFKAIEGIEIMQFDFDDDPKEKRLAAYAKDGSEFIELFSISEDGDLVPVTGDEYSTFVSDMGFAQKFTEAVTQGEDVEDVADIVKEYQKSKSNQTGDDNSE